MSLVNVIRVPGIDVNIQLIFRKEHIQLVLPHFKTIGLADTILNQIIDAHIASGEQVSFERFFLEYGQGVLNPAINEKLKRPKDHPTFNNLLKYVLAEELENSLLLKSFKRSEHLKQ